MATTHDPLAASMEPRTHGPEGSKTEEMKHRLADVTTQARDKASELGRSAKESIDRNFHNAAGALEGAASKIRSRMPQSGEGRMAGIAGTTADKLDSTAHYLRNHDTSDLFRGLESWARRNPGAAIGTAAGIGLMLGISLKRGRRD